jgi:hypothetical protein
MQEKSELHLIVPGICGPLAETQSLKNSDVLTKWVKILSRSKCRDINNMVMPGPASKKHDSADSATLDNLNNVIASIVKLNVGSDFPGASLTMIANDLYDESMFYMHADPVHLRADMDHAVLTSSEDLNITDEESSALITALNKHFEQDDFELLLLNKNQWLLSSKNKIQMKTTALPDATGRNINFILPQGKDAGYWKQMLTEAQMLMHTHAVNVSRENKAEQSINSLWFHGSGVLDGFNNNAVYNICSNQDAMKGLASYLNCAYSTLPGSASDYAGQLLAAKKNTVNILHLADLEHLVNYTDVTPWLDSLTEVLSDWIYPVLKFAHKNNIDVSLYPCNKKQYQFSKYDALKFWLQQGNIEQHVNSY